MQFAFAVHATRDIIWASQCTYLPCRPYRIPWERGGIENIDRFGVGAQERRQLSVLQVRGVVRVLDVVVLAHQGVAVLHRRRHSCRSVGFIDWIVHYIKVEVQSGAVAVSLHDTCEL